MPTARVEPRASPSGRKWERTAQDEAAWQAAVMASREVLVRRDMAWCGEPGEGS